jgi:hypothetical protein
MTQTTTVKYHVHKPERQAFELDAGGLAGNLISPELVPTQVAVLDERAGGVETHFEDASVAFTVFPTQVPDFDDDQRWRETYAAELTKLLSREIDAQEVIIFDHTLRVDDPEATRKPARNVHSDYSVHGAKQRLIDILGAQRAAEWSWQPTPITHGFICPR